MLHPRQSMTTRIQGIKMFSIEEKLTRLIGYEIMVKKVGTALGGGSHLKVAQIGIGRTRYQEVNTEFGFGIRRSQRLVGHVFKTVVFNIVIQVSVKQMDSVLLLRSHLRHDQNPNH